MVVSIIMKFVLQGQGFSDLLILRLLQILVHSGTWEIK